MRVGLWYVLTVLVHQHGFSQAVTDQQYAIVPEVFHQDNYDMCMMRGKEAFYCALTYQLEPIDKDNPAEMWSIVKNLSAVYTNYRHDRLRHWICVPKTCPGINKSADDDPALTKALQECYSRKFEPMGLTGTIAKVACETSEPKYPVDWVDVGAAVFLLAYIVLVLYSTAVEGVARYKPAEEYERLLSTRSGKIIAACSMTRNWIRLKTVKSTVELEKLRSIQGMRVYNTALVVMCHTCLGFIAAPISNTRYPETMHEKNAALFMSSGPLCVSTFFFISSFLLSNGLFEHLKEKKMNLKMVLFAFGNRLFRLTPTVFVVVLFHATWLRHLGSGPNWNHVTGEEFLKCRTNGWTNILYINNWKDPFNMCLPVSWYLALDTQYFILSLFFIWWLKTFEKYIWYLLGAAVSLNIVATFLETYRYDFTALVLPTPEMYFGFSNLFNSHQFHYQQASFIGNMGGPLVGIGFGYYFFKHKNDEKPFFHGRDRTILWWLIAWGIGLGYVIIPGLIILRKNAEHDIFWASLYVAFSRPLFTFAIGTGIIGLTEGVGWLTLRALQWGPTYVLGRLTFSAYLIHMSIVLIRPALQRFPLHLTDFQIAVGFLGDLAMVYIASLLLTLFVEMPLSELQKYVFSVKEAKNHSDVKKPKDN